MSGFTYTRQGTKALVAFTLMAAIVSGCGRESVSIASLSDTIPKPSGKSVESIHANKVEYSPQQLQSGIGPETTWAGYSKPFTLDYPTTLATPLFDELGSSSGTFTTVSGGRVVFLVLDPVDYEYQDINPVKHLAEEKRELLDRCRDGVPEDVTIANGWVGYQDTESRRGGKVRSLLRFFSETEALQVSLSWDEGNEQQHKEAQELLAYGLWSIEIAN